MDAGVLTIEFCLIRTKVAAVKRKAIVVSILSEHFKGTFKLFFDHDVNYDSLSHTCDVTKPPFKCTVQDRVCYISWFDWLLCFSIMMGSDTTKHHIEVERGNPYCVYLLTYLFL